jgi:ADP-heptose:LPS heptosyltransferase
MRAVLRSIIDWFQRARDDLRQAVSQKVLDRSLSQDGPFSNRVLFIRWDAKLGDTVVLSWALRELKAHRPDLSIALITGAAYTSLYRDAYQIDQVFEAPKRMGWVRLFRIARQLRRPRYVVHLSERMKARDMFFLRCLRPAQVIGLDDSLDLVNVKLGVATRSMHFSEKLCGWLESINVPTDKRQYWIPTQNQSHFLAQNQDQKRDQRQDQAPFLDKFKVAGRKLIGLCPFGASRQRRFSDEALWVLLREVLAIKDCAVFLFITHEQREPMAAFLRQNSLEKDVYFDPTTDLVALFDQVRGCDAVVSVDTGIVHVASGLNKPLLAIYNPDGPGEENFACWHPNSDQAIVLIAQRTKPQRIDKLDPVALKSAVARLGSLIEAQAR